MKSSKIYSYSSIGIILIAIGWFLGIFIAEAATVNISVSGSDTLSAICTRLVSPVSPTTPTPPVVVVTPPVGTKGNSISLSNVYITGYADGDNTPPGSPVTDLDGHHGVAGGDCTYSNPTSMAVGHVITNGVDKGDFAYGTIFYVSNVNKGGGCYFKAVDTCGDGSNPQNGPCHKPEQGSLQLDAYVGPKGTASCEESMTKLYNVIQNPLPGLPVKQGNICN